MLYPAIGTAARVTRGPYTGKVGTIIRTNRGPLGVAIAWLDIDGVECAALASDLEPP